MSRHWLKLRKKSRRSRWKKKKISWNSSYWNVEWCKIKRIASLVCVDAVGVVAVNAVVVTVVDAVVVVVVVVTIIFIYAVFFSQR